MRKMIRLLFEVRLDLRVLRVLDAIYHFTSASETVEKQIYVISMNSN